MAERDLPFLPRLRVVRGLMVAMPIQCRQCEDAPCANVCSQGAITRGEYSVEVSQSLCTGCKGCVMACPYGAMGMAPIRHDYPVKLTARKVLSDARHCGPSEEEFTYTAFKCDLCRGRETGPACVEICPNRAFILFDNDVLRRRTAAVPGAAGESRSTA
jgi:electron transport protein HydN